MPDEIIEKRPGLQAESSGKRKADLGYGPNQTETFFQGPYSSIRVLGLPESIPRFRSWFAIAVLTGILIALSIMFITNI